MAEIYRGVRGDKFKYFLRQVLSLSNLKPNYYNVLLDKEGLELYNKVFTHKSADADNNYEYLEFLGDTTLNKSIAWYLTRKFPHLKCPAGVKVLTRLKINLIQKRTFARFAKKFSFWPFVSADDETRSTKMDKTLEDVFESFFGATETLIDERIRIGAGYSVCYNIISKILDDHHISLKYDDLFDAKTRLKELFDHFGEDFGELEYHTEKIERIHHVIAYRTVYEKSVNKASRRNIISKITLGSGSSPLKADAQQKAAEESIRILHGLGYSKPLHQDYQDLCT